MSANQARPRVQSNGKAVREQPKDKSVLAGARKLVALKHVKSTVDQANESDKIASFGRKHSGSISDIAYPPTVTEAQSLEMVKVLLNSTIAGIFLFRDILPRNCVQVALYDPADPKYTYDSLANDEKMLFKGPVRHSERDLPVVYYLTRNSGDRKCNKLLGWLDMIVDQIKLKYIAAIRLVIYDDERRDQENWEEIYRMSVDYTDNEVNLDLSVSNRRGSVYHLRTVSGLKQRICDIMNDLWKIRPNESYDRPLVDIRLDYTTFAPRGYHAPGFMPCACLDIKGARAVDFASKFDTGYHQVTLSHIARQHMRQSQETGQKSEQTLRINSQTGGTPERMRQISQPEDESISTHDSNPREPSIEDVATFHSNNKVDQTVSVFIENQLLRSVNSELLDTQELMDSGRQLDSQSPESSDVRRFLPRSDLTQNRKTPARAGSSTQGTPSPSIDADRDQSASNEKRHQFSTRSIKRVGGNSLEMRSEKRRMVSSYSHHE